MRDKLKCVRTNQVSMLVFVSGAENEADIILSKVFDGIVKREC
jgi:hypothetical protein